MRLTFSSCSARWWWLLPLNLLLLSPALLYELRPRDGGLDGSAAFVLAASALWLILVQTLVRRVWRAHLLLGPFYLVAATDLFIVVHYDTRLSSSMLLVLFENREDTLDYLVSHGTSVLCILVPILATYALALWSMRPLRVRVSTRVPAVAFALLVLSYGAAARRAGCWESLAGHDRSSPFGVLAQSYVAYLVFDASLRDVARSSDFRFGARRRHAPNEPEAYVLVVGESARPDHFGIYGYPRDTTPRLRSMKRLVAFEDVVSQSSLTKDSVPLILTRGVVDAAGRTAHERSVVSAFKEVGFATYWLSVHQRDTFTGAINRYSNEADVQRFYERRHDEALIEHAARALEDTKARKIFLVLHMLGSHFEYRNRYPRRHDFFGADRGDARQRMINAYDNTIRYTDHVLGRLVSLLERRAGIKGLIFVSDHGENLRDDERDLLGHMFGNEYDLPVPMLFWYSSEYGERFPERVQQARHHERRPVSTRSVFHTTLDMAGIDVGDPATERMSLLSSAHVPMTRRVASGAGIVDFDAWLTKHDLTRPLNRSEAERSAMADP